MCHSTTADELNHATKYPGKLVHDSCSAHKWLWPTHPKCDGCTAWNSDIQSEKKPSIHSEWISWQIYSFVGVFHFVFQIFCRRQMHKTPIPAVGWVLMWTREICDTKGFTKCLEIFQQVPWNCPLLSAPISTISCRPFSPARADKNVLFCMTLKESKLAGPHIAPVSTIVFLLPVCEAGFCQCMKGGCSICQGWAKVWLGQ